MEKPVNIKSHLDWRDLLNEIVFERQKSGIDDKNKGVSFQKLTKAMANMINANPKIRNMIIEVKIDVK